MAEEVRDKRYETNYRCSVRIGNLQSDDEWAITAQKAKVYSEKTPTTFERPSLVKKYQKAISPEFLASHLGFLASDFFEGRGTGTRGQRMAAEYLASQYRQMGLSPKGNAQPSPMSPKHYLQSFSLY